MISNLAISEEHGGGLDQRGSVRTWLRLLSCATTIEKLVQRRLGGEFDSTLPRFDLLAALDRSDGGMTMGELSKALLVSNGNVTAIIQSLRRDALVLTTPHPTDKRSSVVSLTPAGRARFAVMAAAHHGWIDDLFSSLDANERDALHAALGHLKSSLDEAIRKERQ
jgi:DNA-binding MarR family transcriptional regulator